MALEFQTVPVNFGLGLDGKTDAKMSVEGKLSVLENGVFTKAKRIQKRNGYDALSDAIIGGGEIGVGKSIAAYKPAPGIEELIKIGGNKLYSYSPEKKQWKEKADVFSLGQKIKSIYRTPNDTLNGDVAINGGYECHVWRDATDAMAGATIIDSSTGVHLALQDSLSASIGRTRCVSIGSYFYVFYVKSGGGVVWRRVDIATPQTFSTETTLTSANTTSPALDVVVADGHMWVALYNSAGNAIVVYKLDSSGSVVTSASITATMSSALTLRVNSNVFVYWFNSTDGLCYAVRDSSLSSVLGKTVIDSDVTDVYSPATAIDVSATEQTVFYGRAVALAVANLGERADYITYSAKVSTSGVTTASSIMVRRVRPASKAFKVGSEVYLWITHPSFLQSTMFLIRASDKKLLAKAFPGVARVASGFSLPSVVEVSSNKYTLTQSVLRSLGQYPIFGAESIKSSISNLIFDFSPNGQPKTAMLGGGLHITGGYLSQYDGKSVVESGFHYYPESIVASSSSTGGYMATGKYYYTAIYQWIDNMGQVHKSAPAPAIEISVSSSTSNGKVELIIPTLTLTDKKNVTIQVYGTEANGSIFYNLRSPGGANVYNNTSVSNITVTDTRNTSTDTAINTHEILYTTGDVLENIAPEACSLIDVYQNRMVIAGLEDPLEVQYSKTLVKGEGVAFSDAFKFRVDPLGGDISAVKLMDDKIIIFKENTIFFVSGDGPSDTGQGGSYSNPILVTSDSGCPYPKSCVLMPLGLMYKSKKGIYLLNRSLQVEYIGADVEEYNAQDVTAATLIQDKNQVRFLTSSGSTLVYDYFFKQWSTFTNHAGNDAVNWQNHYCYLRTDGKVYQESAGFLDDTSGIVLKAATAWMKFAGIQGYQRIRRISFLGDYKSAHQLQIRVGYDYKSAYATTYTFDATTAIASSTNPYEFRVHLATQKCASMRFEFSDVLPVSPGESYSLSDLSLEVGIKRGVNKLAAAKSI